MAEVKRGAILNHVIQGDGFSVDEWKELTKDWDSFQRSIALLLSIARPEERLKIAEECSLKPSGGKVLREIELQFVVNTASLSELALQRLSCSIALNDGEGCYKND